MKNYSDITKSSALNAFLRCSGNFSNAHSLLRAAMPEGEVPSVPTLKSWSEKYMWEATLIHVRNRLQREAAESALISLRQDLARLETTKTRLMSAINGVYDEDGHCVKQPVEARSLESAATALTRVMETQDIWQGKERTYDKQEAESIILSLAKAAMGIPSGGDDKNEPLALPGIGDNQDDSAGDEPLEQ